MLGYLLACYLFNRYGLRFGLLLGGLVQTVGAWIRFLSADNNAHARTNGYGIAMLGQSLCAIIQPIFVNSPAKLSADWFSATQRNMATTIAAMSNPVGIALGQLIPTLVVDETSGMPLMLLITAAIATFTLVASYFGIASQPKTPPSKAYYERMILKKHAHVLQHNQQTGQFTTTDIWNHELMKQFRLLLADRNFVVLMIGVGIGIGLFNTITTLIEQLIKPSSYSKDDAGNCGALLIGAGLVGAGVYGAVMDLTHKYNQILKIGKIRYTKCPISPFG